MLFYRIYTQTTLIFIRKKKLECGFWGFINSSGPVVIFEEQTGAVLSTCTIDVPIKLYTR